jgi:UDP-2-acetamido-3-amino-2,3-dideoxy-glucuronate N-acetyltransferase
MKPAHRSGTSSPRALRDFSGREGPEHLIFPFVPNPIFEQSPLFANAASRWSSIPHFPPPRSVPRPSPGSCTFETPPVAINRTRFVNERCAELPKLAEPVRRIIRQVISLDVVLGKDVVIFQPELVNLYGCTIGDGSRVGAFVEIQRDVTIGGSCKISSHSFICSGVRLEDGVFIGHGVTFVNDRYPAATNADGSLQGAADWECVPTVVRQRASVGSNATILCGITIGEQALVGAGAVVTHDVADFAIVAGNPATQIGDVRKRRS